MLSNLSMPGSTAAGPVVFRNATLEDLVAIIDLHTQMERRSDVSAFPMDVAAPTPDLAYVRAFEELQRDANTNLIVGESAGTVVATLQITYIPGLSLRGTKRAIVEDVRVLNTIRGQGIGRALMDEAKVRARARGCQLLSLTTNSWRTDAITFYERIGLQQTHVALRIKL